VYQQFLSFRAPLTVEFHLSEPLAVLSYVATPVDEAPEGL
jgi:hypothetical protein